MNALEKIKVDGWLSCVSIESQKAYDASLTERRRTSQIERKLLDWEGREHLSGNLFLLG